MYRWTDPIEPDGVPRRPEQPTDEGPAWLTDRPEPRSSYLFGDEPEQPGADWAEAPTGVWHSDAPDTPWRGAPADPRPAPDPAGHHPFEADRSRFGYAADPTGFSHDADRTGFGPTAEGAAFTPAVDDTAPFDPVNHPGAPIAPFERAAGWRPAEEPTATWGPAPDGPAEEVGRHRQKRRFPRPLVIGGAVAAATLVVSLGVSALMLPGDQRTEPTADDAVAAAPVAPETTGAAPGDALAPASPTAAPSSARPSPTRAATPKSSRTTAPSRQLQRRSTPSSTATRTASSNGISTALQQVVDLVNQERAKAGCKALTIDDKLMLAAQRHSQDQADHQTMSHDGSDGSDPGDRLDRVGYAWRAYGENVAWNQKTPAAVMDAWMNSPGHRANILNCSFTEIGVGVARSNGPYWTQDFGTPR
ncbi:CAP domain-containing protein [Micromonospora soli]|uniref:CAP domain-containing protein n=1 Tax=Micromonospora sp. NBRC 110009 TaxID=3061627 RepID=UPI002671D7A7|nr:CAP domain-containing protein [Micromonospora sp. NBRC 110009]WKT99649.1 CAP domain-containing protein [Micromonospora sp. NBRC 110009]